MESNLAILALGALAQDTRLATFRLLMQAEPLGLAAGEVARQLNVPQNTLSTHLAILERAGLVSSARQSRTIIYRAAMAQIRELTSFLVNDCCGGRPELCAPLVAEFTPLCCPEEGSDARC
jgi:ArsR family transcriptional regulator